MARLVGLVALGAFVGCFGICFDKPSEGSGGCGGLPDYEYDSGADAGGCTRECASRCQRMGYAGGYCTWVGSPGCSPSYYDCVCGQSAADADAVADAVADSADGDEIDEAADGDAPDGALACDREACYAACRGAGFLDGACDGALCICEPGGADGDGDGDADAGAAETTDAPEEEDAGVPEPDAEPPGDDGRAPDVPAGVCGDGVTLPPETCDGDPPRACVTWCGSIGSNRCQECAWAPSCEIPADESCNGRDDDCDGEADEGIALCRCDVAADFEHGWGPFGDCPAGDCPPSCPGLSLTDEMSHSGRRSLRVAADGAAGEPHCHARAAEPGSFAGPSETAFDLWVPAVSTWSPCDGPECERGPVVQPIGEFTRSGWIEQDGERRVRWTPDAWMHFEIEHPCDASAGIMRFVLDGIVYFSHGDWRLSCDLSPPMLDVEVETRGAPAAYLDDVCLAPLP